MRREKGAKQTELPDTRGNRNRSNRAWDGPQSSKRIGEIVPDNMTEQNGLQHAMSPCRHVACAHSLGKRKSPSRGITRYRSLASKVRNFPLPTLLFLSHPREDKKDFIEWCGGVTGSRMQLVKALVKVYTVITRTPTFSGLIFIEEGFPVIG
ncbi:hypothetical protein ALC53_05625 [Atta colombica]|uniref:Uncharacterized protein n=1 Tax=Atta colombica TaxID=520822 RepID=A0A151I426_9HYME|nr:hypothetical protein ALC53_05625 [Atta colombica]